MMSHSPIGGKDAFATDHSSLSSCSLVRCLVRGPVGRREGGGCCPDSVILWVCHQSPSRDSTAGG